MKTTSFGKLQVHLPDLNFLQLLLSQTNCKELLETCFHTADGLHNCRISEKCIVMLTNVMTLSPESTCQPVISLSPSFGLRTAVSVERSVELKASHCAIPLP